MVMSKRISLLIIQLFPILIFSQNISYIKIVDSEIYPYNYYNQSVAFEYKINQCGEVSGYVKLNNQVISLFTDSREYKGVGKCLISWETYQKIFSTNLTSKSFSFGLTHLSCREYILSEKELSLKTKVYAPYGTKLHPLPLKPDLLYTNYSIRKKNKKAAWGIAGGYALTILGGMACYVVLDRGESLDWEPIFLTLVGIGTVSYSKNNLYYSIPDNSRNYLNERKNEEMMSQWKYKTDRINYLNERIKATFKIKIQLR